MDTVLWCLARMVVLPCLLSFYAFFYQEESTGETDYHNTRQQVSLLGDYSQRICAALHVSREIIILFTASSVMACIVDYLSVFTMFCLWMFMISLGTATYIVARIGVNPGAGTQTQHALRKGLISQGGAVCDF